MNTKNKKNSTRQKTIRFGVSLGGDLLRSFDGHVREKNYTNRSEAIRDLIRDNLVSQEWEEGKEVVGTITIVYDHDIRELADGLTDLQHESGMVQATLHIHLDEKNCLEVLVLRGRSGELKKIADRLIGTKGVKHGKLVMTTTGKEIS